MKQTFLLLFLLLFLPLAAQAIPLETTYIGESNSNRIGTSEDGQFIITLLSGNGLWKSADGGETWNCINGEVFTLLPNASVYNVDVAGPDADVILLRGLDMDFGHYRWIISRDQGQSWEVMDNTFMENNQGILLISPDDWQSWTYISEDRCASTTNAGQEWVTWTPANIESNQHFRAIAQSPLDSNTLYASVTQPTFTQDPPSFGYGVRLLISEDGGHTWSADEEVINVNEILDIESLFSTSILALSNGDVLLSVGLWEPTDNLETLQNETILRFNEEGEYLGRTGAEFADWSMPDLFFESAENPGTIYARGMRLMKSTDFGASWSPMPDPDQPENAFWLPYPATPFPTGDGFFIASEYGSWRYSEVTELYNDMSWPNVGRIQQLTSTPAGMFAAGERLSWQFREEEQIWETLTELPFVGESRPASLSLHYAQDDTLVMSSYMLNLRYDGDPFDYARDRVYHSYDGGQNWEAGELIPCQQYSIRAVEVDGHVRMFGVQDSNQTPDSLYISDDLGLTWPTSIALPHLVLDYYNSSRPEVVGDRLIFPCNVNGGGTELVLLDPQTLDYSSLGFHEERGTNIYDFKGTNSTVYVLDYYNMLLSYSEGEWTRHGHVGESDFGTELLILPGEPDRLLAYERDPFRMWLSTDNGDSWAEQTFEFDLPLGGRYLVVNAVHDQLQERIWLSCTYGTLWFPVDQLDVPGNIQVHRPTRFAIESLYPNPFNGTTQIRFSVPNRAPVSISIFNTLGQLVLSQELGTLTAGNHFETFDFSRLASGTYILSMQQNGLTQARRLTLLK
ncbi:T9SS type A sorting domain-containing protein [bacterium]|nr:T9SS type A sorting domain-containing protein [bacterium]